MTRKALGIPKMPQMMIAIMKSQGFSWAITAAGMRENKIWAVCNQRLYR
jgi:hypothetical protein